MKNEKGFTIIEVALVLAVAGLIFMMIFLVFPSLARNARDSERRDDLMNFVTKLKNFQTNNNRGALPSGNGTVDYNTITPNTPAYEWGGFYRDFLGAQFKDPNGDNYKLNIAGCGSNTECSNQPTTFDGTTIYVKIGAYCDGETAKYSNNKRKVAALYKLEGGGVACYNS